MICVGNRMYGNESIAMYTDSTIMGKQKSTMKRMLLNVLLHTNIHHVCKIMHSEKNCFN